MSLHSLYSLIGIALFLSTSVFSQQEHHPPFIANASPAVLNSFYALLQANADRPEEQVNAAIDNWASRQSPDIHLAYRAFKEEVIRYHAEEEAAHQAALVKFSPAARQADAQLSMIAGRPGMSFESKQRAIEQLMNSLSQRVRQELLSAMNHGQRR